MLLRGITVLWRKLSVRAQVDGEHRRTRKKDIVGQGTDVAKAPRCADARVWGEFCSQV